MLTQTSQSEVLDQVMVAAGFRQRHWRWRGWTVTRHTHWLCARKGRERRLIDLDACAQFDALTFAAHLEWWLNKFQWPEIRQTDRRRRRVRLAVAATSAILSVIAAVWVCLADIGVRAGTIGSQLGNGGGDGFKLLWLDRTSNGVAVFWSGILEQSTNLIDWTVRNTNLFGTITNTGEPQVYYRVR